MNDKTWLLKPEPMKIAKDCVRIVQTELDVKVLFSHPQFLQILNDYADKMESEPLTESVQKLNQLAGVHEPATVQKLARSKTTQSSTSTVKKHDEELVTYNNKSYPRWHDGKQFSGLYRGQPRYS